MTKTIRVNDENYRRLELLRKTEKGSVSFDEVIGWLLDEKDPRHKKTKSKT